MAKFTHPVDQHLPLAELIPLGLQHILVMYAGAVAVPLIIGRALKLAARTDRDFGECRPLYLRRCHDHTIGRHRPIRAGYKTRATPELLVEKSRPTMLSKTSRPVPSVNVRPWLRGAQEATYHHSD